jgi:hypothetical protein
VFALHYEVARFNLELDKPMHIIAVQELRRFVCCMREDITVRVICVAQ